MQETEILERLEFLRQAERLKDTLRSAHTAQGRMESAAEHSWRLCLFLMVFSDQFPGLDLLKLLKIGIIHDLGEAISGDIPAPEQVGQGSKSESERADFEQLIESLPDSLKSEFLELWDDYEYVQSEEAKVAKAFDKLETLLQHTQGKNPEDFDYVFNFGYGKKHTEKLALSRVIRGIIDQETRRLAQSK